MLTQNLHFESYTLFETNYVFPPPRVNDPDMHHGKCVTHVPWCMSGLLTSGFLWSRWWSALSIVWPFWTLKRSACHSQMETLDVDYLFQRHVYIAMWFTIVYKGNHYFVSSLPIITMIHIHYIMRVYYEKILFGPRMYRWGDSSMRLNKGPCLNVCWALQDELLKYAIIGNVISVVRKGMNGSSSIYLLSIKRKVLSQFNEILWLINWLGSKQSVPHFAYLPI